MSEEEDYYDCMNAMDIADMQSDELRQRIQELAQRHTITGEQINLIESALDVSGSLFHGPTRKAWEAIRAALQEEK